MQKLLLLLILSLVPAVGSAEPLPVFASVLPIRTFIEKVGGEHVDARVMVRPGYNPHTYDPTPRQIGALAEAVLYVRTGVPFEDAWMGRIRSANPAMKVLDARSGIELLAMKSHEPSEEGDREEQDPSDEGQGRQPDHLEHGTDRGPEAHHHESDPHVWTSPPLVMHMVGLIRDKLAELDPAHAADYTRNRDTYVAALQALDREIRTLLEPLHERKFMVFHPAWGSFAETYGLVQVPIERQGKAPGARSLAALIDQAKQEGVRVVFVQPQFDRRQAEQVARAIGGSVIAVDPLAPDYIDNLRAVARQFAEALEP